MCSLYNVSRAGYYAWKKKGVSIRHIKDMSLLKEIRLIYNKSHRTYGSPRIFRELRAKDIRVGKKRVERIMRENSIKARSVRMYRAKPGVKKFYQKVPNRERGYEITAPNQVWVGDLTYLKVNKTNKYLAVVMDKFSRRIIGWSLGNNKDAKLTTQALNNAIKLRKPKTGIYFHTDRGIEYGAHKFSNRLKQFGFIQSMNRVKNMNDNAFMESFFHSFKLEYYHGKVFNCMSELRRTIESYIPFYNYRRMHSSLGYISPVQFERNLC